MPDLGAIMSELETEIGLLQQQYITYQLSAPYRSTRDELLADVLGYLEDLQSFEAILHPEWVRKQRQILESIRVKLAPTNELTHILQDENIQLTHILQDENSEFIQKQEQIQQRLLSDQNRVLDQIGQNIDVITEMTRTLDEELTSQIKLTTELNNEAETIQGRLERGSKRVEDLIDKSSDSCNLLTIAGLSTVLAGLTAGVFISSR